jgi:superfamily II DNA or RNA helicase
MRNIGLSGIQREAADHIHRAFSRHINPLCALGMGSGKTRVACSIIAEIQRSKAHFRILISAKTSLINTTWMTELETCGLSKQPANIILLQGKGREDYVSERGKYLFEGNDIILTSYDTLVRDIENDRYGENDIFDLIIIDEIQLFMNSKRLTKRCKTIATLPSLRRLALSGTPIQNSPHELGLIFLFLNNPDAIPYSRSVPEDILEAALADCKTNDAVFYHFETNKGYFRKYEALLFLPVNQAALSFARENLVNQRRRLMYLSHPHSVYYQHYETKENIFCAKLETVKAILSERRREKCIVFSQFIDVLYCYKESLAKMGIISIMLTGNDKGDKLDEKLDIFRSSKQCNVLLTTLQKSSEGLSLSFANHIIILELWWNPQKVFQAMNRIDRKDQKHNIFIYLLCYHDSRKFIDEEVSFYKAMKRKNDEANTILKEYGNNSDSEELRKLPESLIIDDIHNFNAELSLKLKNIYQRHYFATDYYIEEDNGRPLHEIMDEIKKHPLFENKLREILVAGIQYAINESNKAEKKRKQR